MKVSGSAGFTATMMIQIGRARMRMRTIPLQLRRVGRNCGKARTASARRMKSALGIAIDAVVAMPHSVTMKE